MQEMRIKLKHLGIVARPRTLRNLVLNSCKSKTRLKIMKLGMDVMSWYYHVVVKNLAEIGTDFGISFLQTEASLKKARGLRGNVPPLSAKRYTLSPLSLFTKAT